MRNLEIISVVTTKDRVDFLEESLKSVRNQSYKPNRLFVASDSESKEAQEREKELCKEFGAVFAQNTHTKNCYAGNLNSAIEYILSDYLRTPEREKIA